MILQMGLNTIVMRSVVEEFKHMSIPTDDVSIVRELTSTIDRYIRTVKVCKEIANSLEVIPNDGQMSTLFAELREMLISRNVFLARE